MFGIRQGSSGVLLEPSHAHSFPRYLHLLPRCGGEASGPARLGLSGPRENVCADPCAPLSLVCSEQADYQWPFSGPTRAASLWQNKPETCPLLSRADSFLDSAQARSLPVLGQGKSLSP